MISLKLILFCYGMITLIGCAFSGTGKYEFINFAQAESEHTDEIYSISIMCPEKIYTVMVSPLIPLPPIIPIAGINEKISHLHMKVPIDRNVSISLKDSEKRTVDLPYKEESVEPSHNDPAKADYYYALNKSCESLDKHYLEVRIENPASRGFQKIIYLLDYESGDLRFEWGYFQ